MKRWVIEVVYGIDEGRSQRYFDGNVLPGWHGCTTLDVSKAVHYERAFAAYEDMAKLARRELGRWDVTLHEIPA